MFANGNVPFNPVSVDFSALAQLPEIYRQSQLRQIQAFDENGNPNYQAMWQYSPQTALEAYKTAQGTNGQFGTPIYGIDRETNQPVVGALQRQGGVSWYGSNGQSVTPTKGVQFLNTGTGYTGVDRLTGQPTNGGDSGMPADGTTGLPGETPPSNPYAIDVQGKRTQEKTGDIAANAKAALPAAQSMVNRVIGAINSVEKDPNLTHAIGPVQSKLLTLRPGTADVEAKINQAIGGVFTSAYESLRGAQAITDIEGEKATNAITRLQNLNQSDPGYREALKDAKYEVFNLLNIVRHKAGLKEMENPFPAPKESPEITGADTANPPPVKTNQGNVIDYKDWLNQ